MKNCQHLVCILAALLLVACSKTPKGIISEGNMAELLADMSEGDAVVELNRDAYANEDARKALKQSILMKHGYTQEDFEKSLMWYGHNLDIYDEVYEDAITILEQRQRDAKKEAKAAGEKLIAAGDSVDIWQLSHSLMFDRRQNGETVQLDFSFNSDSEMRKGDRYEWRMFIVNSKNAAHLLLGVDYADGTTEYQTLSLMPESTSPIVLQTDSTRAPKRVYGYLDYRMATESSVIVDKISLSRSRLRSETYSQHSFQRTQKN